MRKPNRLHSALRIPPSALVALCLYSALRTPPSAIGQFTSAIDTTTQTTNSYTINYAASTVWGLYTNLPATLWNSNYLVIGDVPAVESAKINVGFSNAWAWAIGQSNALLAVSNSIGGGGSVSGAGTNGNYIAATNGSGNNINLLGITDLANGNLTVGLTGSGAGLIPLMTASNAPSGLAVASYEVLSGDMHPAWLAFSTTNFSAEWASHEGTWTNWIEYDFPAPVVVGSSIIYWDYPYYWNMQLQYELNTNWITVWHQYTTWTTPYWLTNSFPPVSASNWRWLISSAGPSGGYFSAQLYAPPPSIVVSNSAPLEIVSSNTIDFETPNLTWNGLPIGAGSSSGGVYIAEQNGFGANAALAGTNNISGTIFYSGITNFITASLLVSNAYDSKVGGLNCTNANGIYLPSGGAALTNFNGWTISPWLVNGQVYEYLLSPATNLASAADEVWYSSSPSQVGGYSPAPGNPFLASNTGYASFLSVQPNPAAVVAVTNAQVAIGTNSAGGNALEVFGNVDSTVGFTVNGVPLGGGGGSATLPTNTVKSSIQYLSYMTNTAFWRASNYLGTVPNLYRFNLSGGDDGGANLNSLPTPIPATLAGSLDGVTWFIVTNGYTSATNIQLAVLSALTNVYGAPQVDPGFASIYSVDHPELIGRVNSFFGQSFQVGTPTNAADVTPKSYVDSAVANVTAQFSSTQTNGMTFTTYTVSGQGIYQTAQSSGYAPILSFTASTNGVLIPYSGATGFYFQPTNAILAVMASNLTPGWSLITSTNLGLQYGWFSATNFSTNIVGGTNYLTVPINPAYQAQFFRVLLSETSAFSVLTVLTVNQGVLYPSNAWNLNTITSAMPNLSFWVGSSNGQALVSVFLSNGVARLKQVVP